ncbi:MAG: hypothetical protein ABI425_05390 [Patescibacteria group bacterium]
MSNIEHLEESIEAHLEQVRQALAEFRDKFAVSFIVSISGGAEEHNTTYAHDVISQLIVGLKNSSCAILTGGTQGGIPELGTRIAREHKLSTIAVFPPKAKKYVLFNELDLPIETLPPSVGPAGFGSETPSFAQLPDYAVFIGGSYGTLAEVSTMMKVNTKRKKDNVEPIYIVPIAGSEGVAALIPLLVQLNPSLAFCLPEFELTTGAAAAEFIKETQSKR